MRSYEYPHQRIKNREGRYSAFPCLLYPEDLPGKAYSAKGVFGIENAQGNDPFDRRESSDDEKTFGWKAINGKMSGKSELYPDVADSR